MCDQENWTFKGCKDLNKKISEVHFLACTFRDRKVFFFKKNFQKKFKKLKVVTNIYNAKRVATFHKILLRVWDRHSSFSMLIKLFVVPKDESWKRSWETFPLLRKFYRQPQSDTTQPELRMAEVKARNVVKACRHSTDWFKEPQFLLAPVIKTSVSWKTQLFLSLHWRYPVDLIYFWVPWTWMWKILSKNWWSAVKKLFLLRGKFQFSGDKIFCSSI